MDTSKSHLDQISEIRNMMERSSKFISLSGLSGVWVGLVALAGMAAVFFNYQDYFLMRYSDSVGNYPEYLISSNLFSEFVKFLVIDGIIVLALAVLGAVALTLRKSTRKGLPVWDQTTKRFLVSLSVPLFAGGILILILVYHGILEIAGPLTLIFYGLALFNAGRYSLTEIRYLGLMEILLGFFAALFLGYSAIFWGIGFGILHIIYGVVMYLKYDRK